MRILRTTFIGEKYSNWEVLSLPIKIKGKKGRYCNCKCLLCGNNYDNIRFENMYMGISKNCKKCGLDKSSKILLTKRKEFVGKKYNKLTIMDIVNKRDYKGGGQNYFKCKCDCGNIKDISSWRVIKGDTKSCGCLLNICSSHANNVKDLVGLKRGLLTLIGEDENNDRKKGVKKYLFKCDCGSGRLVKSSLYDFRNGKVLSCGCTKSSKQLDMYNFIKGLGFNCIENYKEGDSKIEIDVYIPEINIGFEFNGMYWHSLSYKDRMYHYNKKMYFYKKGINIITIREDEWDNKIEIVKGFIKSKLGFGEKIYARNLDIKNISHKDYIAFCDNNHMQGRSQNVKVTIGSYLNNELISVAGFTGSGVMVRYCVKIGIKIIGGFEKVISFYRKLLLSNQIITYANLDIVDIDNNVYERNGFIKGEITFGSFFSDQKYYRVDKRKLKSLFNVSDDAINEDFLNKIGYVECVGSGIQKYILHTGNY